MLKVRGAAARASRSAHDALGPRGSLDHRQERDLGFEPPQDLQRVVGRVVVHDDPASRQQSLRSDGANHALDVGGLVADRRDDQDARLGGARLWTAGER